MQVIFCSNPLESQKPDELYESEATAVEQFGLGKSLINYEALVFENDPEKAVRKVRQPASDDDAVAIYRGWMLSTAHYQSFHNALRNRGIMLINDPQNYKHCHHLPEWVNLFEGQTPHSVWIDKEILTENLMHTVMEKLLVFGSEAVIVKDFVKSEKHHWTEACFIPCASDREQVERVVSRFLKLRGDDLEGGLVFRKFVKFKPLATHSKSGMPLTKEFRLFVLNGKIIHWFNYWEEGNYGDLLPPLNQFADYAQKPRSRFFTMDIAQTVDDEWLVVELGDAQVAGLPENASAQDFYRSLCGVLSSSKVDG